MASDAQARAAAPQPKPTRVSLSYEEISKLFSLPIAEAASILGVCTSVLKRICRTHGIVRWPYRKLVSGKVGDDIKNAEREKAKELLEFSKMAKQKAQISAGSSTISSSAPQGAAKSQLGISKSGQVMSQGNKMAPSGSLNLAQAGQTKSIPTFMDDFKYGFPSTGLPSASGKWWGTSSHTESTIPVKDECSEILDSAIETSKGMTDDELDWGADDTDSMITSEPSAMLCSLRRKAVDDGRELLNGEAYKAQELYRLNKQQKLVLVQVFGTSLPEQWKNKLL